MKFSHKIKEIHKRATCNARISPKVNYPNNEIELNEVHIRLQPSRNVQSYQSLNVHASIQRFLCHLPGNSLSATKSRWKITCEETKTISLIYDHSTII